MSVSDTSSPKRTTVVVTKEIREKLKTLKKELGFANYNALLNYAVLELTREGLIPPADYRLVFEKYGTKPVILTGKTGSGKTTTVRNLLNAWSGSVFILDVRGDEYSHIKRVDLGRIFSMNWSKQARIRFVPNKNIEAARGEASAIFGHLNFLKNSEQLKDWAIVIEEGHRFATDANLRALLIEGRKFVRKAILVTTDWKVYEGITEVVKPPPWEALPP